jgi:lambda repressor-like predicted transcriptional regulator
MYRLAFVLIVALLMGCTPKVDNEGSIRHVFQAYRSAVLSNDGEAAWSVVDSDTQSYYAGIVQDALLLQRADLKNLDFLSRLMVLRMRLEFKKSELQKLDGKSMFIMAIEKSWISRSSVQKVDKLGKIKLDGKQATASIAEAPQVPIFFFAREDKEWKMALSKSFEQANTTMRAMAKKNGLSENNLIKVMLKKLYKDGLDERIIDGPLE